MRIEPSGDMRYMAATLMQAKLAFEDAGFSEKEAFQLTRDLLTSSLSSDTEGEK